MRQYAVHAKGRHLIRSLQHDYLRIVQTASKNGGLVISQEFDRRINDLVLAMLKPNAVDRPSLAFAKTVLLEVHKDELL